MKIQSKLARFDLTMIVVSFVVGIGIFKTPSIIAAKAGTPAVFYAAWVIGGIISVFGALTFAEIGARLPVAGGFYKIFSHCYNPVTAFMFNWALVIVYAGGAVAVAVAGAEYIRPVLVPEHYQDVISKKMIAFAVITILFVLNYVGIKMGSRVQNILSSIKIIMVVIFCLAIFGVHNVADVAPVVQSPFDALKALGVCLISIFFTYNGYQMTINLGADVQDAQKTIPRAIFTGMGIVFVLYIMINIAYCQVLGFEHLKGMELPAAALAQQFFGDAGSKITSVVIFISVLGFLNTLFISNPRVYHAMADDKILPPVFKKVNSKTQTQEFAISFFYGLMLVSLLTFEAFEKVMNYVTFIDCLAIAFAAGTIFILRMRATGKGYNGFKIRFFPVIPVIFIIVLLIVCVNVFISDLQPALIGIAIFLAGFPLYHLIRFFTKEKEISENVG